MQAKKTLGLSLLVTTSFLLNPVLSLEEALADAHQMDSMVDQTSDASVKDESLSSEAGSEMSSDQEGISTSSAQDNKIPTDPEALKKAIKDYGDKITVKGHQMNVLELGKEHKGKSKTLVFMPGLGEASQPMTHKNLLDRLAKKYHILVVEPFGYGLSDVSHEDRTVENIVDELHQALEQMKVDSYVLVAHSLSGIYAMKYAQSYPKEVEALVGMDTSTPMMNGYMDIQHEEAPVDDSGQATDLPEIPDVPEEVNQQYKMLAQLNLNNADVADESQRSNQVLIDAKDDKLPAGIPALYLLAQDSYEDMEMRREYFDQITEDWTDQHKSLSENPETVECHVLEGDHLLYMTQYQEMSDLIDKFLSQLK